MKANLARVEWDFTSVPDREVIACFEWECAREYSDTEPQIRMLENLPDDDIYKREEGEWASLTGIAPAPMLVGKSNLLSTPWLLLPWTVRADCSDYVPQPLKEAEVNDFKVFEAFRGRKGEGVNMLCFEVDWSASDSRIIEEFSRWLSTTRVKPPKERRGSNTRDALKMLGAMRLMHHYPLEEAVRLTTKLLGKPLYGPRPSWERARKGAVNAIFETLFFEHPAEGGDEDLILDELNSYEKFCKEPKKRKQIS